MVVYFDRVCFKWYRALVDFHFEQTSNIDSYILWLVDYGFPVRTFSNHIYKLDKKFYAPESFGNVLKVGVSNVLPANEDYDYLNERPVVEIADHWNNSTVTQLKKILEASNGIDFLEKIRFKEQLFGDLYIHTNTGKVLDLCKVLAKSANAFKIDDNQEFLQKLKYLKAINVERYQDNNRQCIKSPEQSKPSRKSNETPSQPKNLLKSLGSVSIASGSSITTTTTSSDDVHEMPLLVHSSNENATDNTFDTYSYESETSSISSKKISKILERLNKRPKLTRNTETSTKNLIKHEERQSSNANFVPACYDQIMSQEARAHKMDSPPKSTSSSEISPRKPKKKSRLDKLLAVGKTSHATKNIIKPIIDTPPSTTTTTITDENSSIISLLSSIENVTSRITKVKLATVTDLDPHDWFKCRQNVKHRGDDEG